MTMKTRNQGSVVIHNDEKEVGIVTMKDILDVYLSGMNPEDKVESIMNPQLFYVDSNETRDSASQEFINHKVHHLLVKTDDKLVGIISTMDIVKDISKDAEDHFPYLRRLLYIESGDRPLTSQISTGISKLAEKLHLKNK